jgi:hypothetical protein
MLWYKTWLEMRTRLSIGLVLLLLSAIGSMLLYPEVKEVAPLARSGPLAGDFAREVQENLALASTYRGYLWSQLIGQKQTLLLVLFAALLGTGSVIAQSTGDGRLFTLSLPVLRTRLLLVRAGTGLLGLLSLAFVPMLALAMLSPAIGETYSLMDASAHALCLFVGAAALFSLTLLFATLLDDVWRPLLLTLLAVVVLRLLTSVLFDAGRFDVPAIMTGERWFRDERLPWEGLLASLAASAAFLATAAARLKRADF